MIFEAFVDLAFLDDFLLFHSLLFRMDSLFWAVFTLVLMYSCVTNFGHLVFLVCSSYLFLFPRLLEIELVRFAPYVP